MNRPTLLINKNTLRTGKKKKKKTEKSRPSMSKEGGFRHGTELTNSPASSAVTQKMNIDTTK